MLFRSTCNIGAADLDVPSSAESHPLLLSPRDNASVGSTETAGEWSSARYRCVELEHSTSSSSSSDAWHCVADAVSVPPRSACFGTPQPHTTNDKSRNKQKKENKKRKKEKRTRDVDIYIYIYIYIYKHIYIYIK